MEKPASNDQPQRRRRWTYSLRSFLIVVMLIGIGLGWFTNRLRRAQRQKEAVAVLYEAGGYIVYDSGDQYDPFLTAREARPQWLRERLGVDFVADVVVVEMQHHMRVYPPMGTGGLAPHGFVSPDMTSDDMRQLAWLPDIERLILADMDAIPGGNLAVLRNLKSLTQLKIEVAELDGAMLTHLGSLNRLEKLELARSFRFSPYDPKDAGREDHHISGDDLRHLSRLHSLTYLDLSRTNVDDDGLRHLASLASLEYLSLSGTEVRGPGLEDLAELNNLRELHLSYMPLDDDALRHLASVRQIETLSLWETNITDVGLEHLQAMKNLKHLDVGETGVTTAAMVTISKLESLMSLDISDTVVDDLSALRSMPNLREVDAYGASISAEDMEWIASLPGIAPPESTLSPEESDFDIPLPPLDDVNFSLEP